MLKACVCIFLGERKLAAIRKMLMKLTTGFGLAFKNDDEVISFLQTIYSGKETQSTFFTRVDKYRVCHGFSLSKRDDYFQVVFDHF